MNPYFIIEKNNVFYKVLKEDTESNEQFYDRCNFISEKKQRSKICVILSSFFVILTLRQK